ncbi:MAG: response regulator transcription factor, partial [Bacteroidota bacterium]
ATPHPEYLGAVPDPCEGLLRQVRVNELMANPDGTDTGREWREKSMNSAEKDIRIALVEDDFEIRESLKLILNASPGYACVQQFETAEEALVGLEADPPDVCLMDISLPGISGIECVRLVKEKNTGTEFIMLTAHQDDDLVFDALCAGACGYLIKSTPPARIMDAIVEAYHGGAPMSTKIARLVVNSFKKPKTSNLTAREQEVLDQLCQGKSYKGIADALFVSQDTIRSHIKSIYKKLEVNSKSEAVIKAIKEKLV